MDNLNSGGSKRQARVTSMINIALNDILNNSRALDKVLIDNKITITKLDISPDLRSLICYFVPFGRQAGKSILEEALKKSNTEIRRQLAQKVQMRRVPEIKFLYDGGYDNQIEVEELLAKSLKH